MRFIRRAGLLFAFTALSLTAAGAMSPAQAQSASISGNVSALIDHLPNVPAPGAAAGKDPVTELRLRAIADAHVEPRPWLRFRFAGLADGLVADRAGSVRDARADALEAWVELSGPGADLRAGMSRIAWGRLDEVQPTDVINPIDVSRYLLDGRSEARIAVPLVRARVFPSAAAVLELVLVPVFRHGTFDRLDEATSPFNLLLDTSPSDLPPPYCWSAAGQPCHDRWTIARAEPEGRRLQGGGRVSATTGRVDWSVSGWSGYLPFGLVAAPQLPLSGTLTLTHPRYTMFGGDFETVRGRWALRGEGAYFPNRPTQADFPLGIFNADALEAGVGVDRRAGDFMLSATALLRVAHRQYRMPAFPGLREPYRILDERLTDVSLVGGFSRSFDRDRIETRLFSLVNPEDRAAFVRGIFAWKPLDDVAVESSIGWFIGDGDDVITRFGDRDFGYVRLKYYFGR